MTGGDRVLQGARRGYGAESHGEASLSDDVSAHTPMAFEGL
jgi:hypothetical protein